MEAASSRWREVAKAVHAAEAEGLDHLRLHLPDDPAYHVWSNLTFRSQRGACHEVDAIVIAPSGLYLIELKGYRDVSGNDLVWRLAGRPGTEKHPFIAADQKAKHFGSRLGRAAGRHERDVPWAAAAVFLHDKSLINRLDRDGRNNVFGREDAPAGGLPGIVTGLLGRPAGQPRHAIDRRKADWLAGLIDRLGFEPRQLTVGPVRLDDMEPYAEGPGWQDYVGHDQMSANLRRRIRMFRVSQGGSAEERATLSRAAAREIHLMEGITHPGIAKPLGIVDHDPDTALVYEHHNDQQRLDDHLAERASDPDLRWRLRLVRQLGQALRTAHSHGLFHRALSPSCVDVRRPGSRPQAVITGWQTGGRESMTALGSATLLAGTRHLGRLVGPAETAYHAPETGDSMCGGPAADVFSLGAVAFRVVTGRAPAASQAELLTLLPASGGLDTGELAGSGGAALRGLILASTSGTVSDRLPDVARFLDRLDEAERLLEADRLGPVDPLDSNRGEVLDGLFRVERRLDRGSTARSLLVSRVDEPAAEPVVLKVALDHDKEPWLEAEAEALARIDDWRVVKSRPGPPYVGGRRTLVLEYCGEDTLRDRLQQDRLHIGQVRRFGEDLLGIVACLETSGVRHRDIKPENLGVHKHDSDGKPHLVLYDFSMARVPATDLTSGTAPYLDPFLGAPDRPRYDAHAERFAAVVTLYEMAAGVKPRWGDGSDPRVTTAEVAIESGRFDATVRERMTAFFGTALARRADRRHPGVAALAQDWHDVFRPAPIPAPRSAVEVPARVTAPVAAVARVTAGAAEQPATIAVGPSTKTKPTVGPAEVAMVRQALLRELATEDPLLFSKVGVVARRAVPWIDEANWGGGRKLTGFIALYLKDFPRVTTKGEAALRAPAAAKAAVVKKTPPPPPEVPAVEEADIELIRKALIRAARQRNPLPLPQAREAIRGVAPWIVETGYARRRSITRFLEEFFVDFTCADNYLRVPGRWALAKNLGAKIVNRWFPT